jgi:hypothetical protein
VDLSGWGGVGLGGNCDCRCGILYAPMLGGGGGILHKTLLARKLSKPEDGRYRPKHVVFLHC